MEEIRTAIRLKGLTNLSTPREILYVRDLPKLGTGKIDHRGLAKVLAASAAPATGEAAPAVGG